MDEFDDKMGLIIQSRGVDWYNVMSIRYLGVGRLASALPVVDYCGQREQREKVRGEVARVIQILKDGKIESEDKQRFKSEFGSWHCKKDDKGMLYLLLAASDLPERQVYAVLSKLRSHLSILPDYQNQADETLIEHSLAAITQICQIFNAQIEQTSRSTDQQQLQRGKVIRSSSGVDPRVSIRKMSLKERQSQMQVFNAHFIEIEQLQQPDRLCLNWKSNLLRGAALLLMLAAIILPIVFIVGKRV